jgi:hypothetical protein
MILNVVLLLFVNQLRDVLAGVGGEQVLLIVGLILAALDIVVNTVAVTCFKRSRLFLD